MICGRTSRVKEPLAHWCKAHFNHEIPFESPLRCMCNFVITTFSHTAIQLLLIEKMMTSDELRRR